MPRSQIVTYVGTEVGRLILGTLDRSTFAEMPIRRGLVTGTGHGSFLRRRNGSVCSTGWASEGSQVRRQARASLRESANTSSVTATSSAECAALRNQGSRPSSAGITPRPIIPMITVSYRAAS